MLGALCLGQMNESHSILFYIRLFCHVVWFTLSDFRTFERSVGSNLRVEKDV